MRAVLLALLLHVAACSAIWGLDEFSLGSSSSGGGGPSATTGAGGNGEGGEGACAPTCDAGCVEEPSTDPEHCGGCGKLCEDGVACVSGACEPHQVSVGESSPVSLVVDSSHIYWLNQASNTVRRWSAPAGVETVLVYADTNELTDITIAGDTLCAINGAEVLSRPILGSGNMVAVASGLGIYSFAADEMTIYWTDLVSSSLNKVDIRGGTPVTLFSMESNPRDIAIGGSKIYWISDVSLKAAASDGSSAVEIATLDAANHVSVSGDKICADIDVQQKLRCMVTDGTLLRDFSATGGYISAFVLVGEHVYWTESDQAIMRGRISGGEVVRLAESALTPVSIAVQVDGSKHRVFWADEGGNVMKLVTWVD